MATLPKIIQRYVTPQAPAQPAAAAAPAEMSVCVLRALPQEDVFFFCKKVDNSRLVREPDPKARGACWNVIGAACLAAASLGVVMAPKVANTMDGYKLEALRSEEQRLLDERRALALQEAQLLSPSRLEQLAKSQHLAPPASDQVYHLETRPADAVAMAK